MPRPKKAGAPQPKKRSRNGCWPCKTRKVKCDEAKPSCLNCQRQGEACDYSVRLKWDGRGKKSSESTGQFVFSSAVINSTIQTAELRDSEYSEDRHEVEASPGGPHDPGINNIGKPPGAVPSEVLPSPYAPQQNATLSHYSSEPYSLSSVIDPTLMDVQNSGASTYLPGPHRANTRSDLSYAQSYERHNSRPNNTQTLARQSSGQEISAILRHKVGNQLQHSIPEQKLPIPPSSVDYTATEDEGIDTESVAAVQPFKRVKYSHPIRYDNSVSGAKDMPPPDVGSSPYGWGTYNANQQSTIPLGSTSAPMTPSTSSTLSDDGYKYFPAKLASYTSQNSPGFRRLSQETSDPRRLSVESLLSGPPGMPEQHTPKSSGRQTSDVVTPRPTSAGSGEFLEEVTTHGVDRGFRDFDVGKNDDANAISGGSPITKGDYLKLSTAGDGDDGPIEFGFGVQAKDTSFEKNDYYAQPVTIKIPRSFEPLPPVLIDNPMNLLYFHHFISHTARLLVPHHCSSNPFQKILPQMALQDQNLMNLLLAYSASHRARLLQQPEPVMRIALWVEDVFPNLRHALSDPSRIVSNPNLAAAIMLASLEIISPKVFGIAVPWQQHLLMARSMVMARGGVRSMYFERSDVSRFLLHWFAYIDVLGSLIDGPTDPALEKGCLESSTDEGNRNGWLGEYDFVVEDDYQIDCLFGFTGRCISLLANIAELARSCDIQRIDTENNIRPEWTPSAEVSARAEKLILDLEAARTNTRVQACPHLHSESESAYQWDTREMTATNEAYHWAGLVHLHRRILGKSATHPDVQNAVREISGALYKVRKGSTAEFCLLFPMFTAGCDAQDEKQKAVIMDRFRGIEGFGMSQVRKARTLMQKVWDTGKPWETLVSGEFVG